MGMAGNGKTKSHSRTSLLCTAPLNFHSGSLAGNDLLTLTTSSPVSIQTQSLALRTEPLAFLAVFVYTTHATQAIAFEWKPGFRDVDCGVQPMLPMEHNGEGFHYIVNYKRHEPSTPRTASEVMTRVTDWRQSQLVVNHVETYAEYIVAVQAANSVGKAPQTSVERRIGHSGENGEQLSRSTRIVVRTLTPVSIQTQSLALRALRKRKPQETQEHSYWLALAFVA